MAARDLAQRRAALVKANEVRVERARLKDRVHADPSWSELYHAVGEPLPLTDGMLVLDLLVVAPGIGAARAAAAMRVADLHNRSATFAMLSPERRTALVDVLVEARRRRADDAVNRYAATPLRRHARRTP